MQYTEFVQVASDLVLKHGRTTLINATTIDQLITGEFLDVVVQVTSGIPAEGALLGINLKYVDEPMPRAGYNPRFRGRVMTDNQLGTYHSIDLVRLEKDMQLCIFSNEKQTDLTVNVFIRAKS